LPYFVPHGTFQYTTRRYISAWPAWPSMTICVPIYPFIARSYECSIATRGCMKITKGLIAAAIRLIWNPLACRSNQSCYRCLSKIMRSSLKHYTFFRQRINNRLFYTFQEIYLKLLCFEKKNKTNMSWLRTRLAKNVLFSYPTRKNFAFGKRTTLKNTKHLFFLCSFVIKYVML